MALEVYVILLLWNWLLARSINYVTSVINLDFRFFMKPTTGHTERVRLMELGRNSMFSLILLVVYELNLDKLGKSETSNKAKVIKTLFFNHESVVNKHANYFGWWHNII